MLRDWRFDYEVECTGLPDDDATRAFAARAIEGHVARGEAFLLEVDGTPVSLCTHNARVRDHVLNRRAWGERFFSPKTRRPVVLTRLSGFGRLANLV
jgi:hypothetical protein